MRQYEMSVRIAQVHHLIEERKYKKALAVIETLDIHQIRGLSDLNAIAEVYSRTGRFVEALDTFTKIYRKSKTKRVLQRMIFLAIRTGDLEDAEEYYQEFAEMNPSNRDLLTLRYRIDKAVNVPIGQLIEVLEALKEEEYVEEWAYELAKLYHAAGRYEDCRNECDDIITWFGYGEIVEHAKRLIEYVDDKDAMPFMDDKDFTVEKEEPNPEYTGSLPALDEYIEDEKQKKKQAKQRAEQIRQEAKERRKAAKHGGKENDDSDFGEVTFDDDFMDDFRVELPDDDVFNASEKEPWEQERHEKGGPRKQETPNRKEKHEQEAKGNEVKHEQVNSKAVEQIPQVVYTPPSQSGLGITQDLAREISAIVAAENGEQLEEKEISVVPDELHEKNNQYAGS